MSNLYCFSLSVVRGGAIGYILSESRSIADDADFKSLSFLDEVSQTWYIIHIDF